MACASRRFPLLLVSPSFLGPSPSSASWRNSLFQLGRTTLVFCTFGAMRRHHVHRQAKWYLLITNGANHRNRAADPPRWLNLFHADGAWPFFALPDLKFHFVILAGNWTAYF